MCCFNIILTSTLYILIIDKTYEGMYMAELQFRNILAPMELEKEFHETVWWGGGGGRGGGGRHIQIDKTMV